MAQADDGVDEWLQADWSTQSPIELINPVSSVSGMKSEGGMVPSNALFQRKSASAPRIRRSVSVEKSVRYRVHLP
jgi:hypothetical protein